MDENRNPETRMPKEDDTSEPGQTPGSTGQPGQGGQGGSQGSDWNKETGGIQPGTGESESPDWKPKETGRGTPESES